MTEDRAEGQQAVSSSPTEGSTTPAREMQDAGQASHQALLASGDVLQGFWVHQAQGGARNGETHAAPHILTWQGSSAGQHGRGLHQASPSSVGDTAIAPRAWPRSDGWRWQLTQDMHAQVPEAGMLALPHEGGPWAVPCQTCLGMSYACKGRGDKTTCKQCVLCTLAWLSDWHA